MIKNTLFGRRNEKKDRRAGKGLAALIVIAALSAVMSLCYLGGLFRFLEYKTYDLRVNLFAKSSRPSDDIIVILLDQDSIDWANRERGWGWPWPRKAYAEFVDYMNASGAASVAFDVLFSEPSVYRNADQDAILDRAIEGINQMQAMFEAAQREREAAGQAGAERQPRQPGEQRQRRGDGGAFGEVIRSLRELDSRADDASFAQAERDYGRVVQTVFFSTQSGSTTEWPADLDKPLFTLRGFGGMAGRFTLSESEGAAAQFPIPSLREAAGVVGNVTGSGDSDSTFRRIRLFTLFDGKAVPGLSAGSLLVSGAGRELRCDAAAGELLWDGRRIPIDREGKTLLRFRGDLNRYFPYSAADILKSAAAYAKGEEPLLPPENFKDKYVFFGYYAPGLFDICSTPISSVYPGMGMHITMLDNILCGDFIRESAAWVDLLLIILTITLVTLLVFYAGKVPLQVAGTLLVAAAVTGLGLGAYQIAGLWLPLAAPLFAAALAFLSAAVYNYASEGSQKRFIQSAFSRYLSPEVIHQIIADPSKLDLGGERREMTAIFTDIQRFSSISSELQDQYGEDGPKVLVNLLNRYLTEMSNIVLAHKGTVDKYEGDAIIAFFGAPLPAPDHAVLACRTAISMKKRELALREEILDPAGAFHIALEKLIDARVIRAERPLYTRIGVNTGDMVVGNMGTPNKMDYTIMGNAVNLAARLEGVNKQYDTSGILVSEYTRAKIGDEFVVRPLSRVTVVGIPTPLRLYELLDTREDAPQALRDMAALWEEALRRYEARDFAAARDLFAGIADANQDDRAARLYQRRCEAFLREPPPAAWSGVDNLTEK
ncbi:MAG: adenylate/guanylate cyclase domain-containing protein [Treponema sp.]|jgi:adenylate cyclase|nr:adenylate/guanylate cyclase domain-containing protein [Treponema sp.]